MPVTAHAGLARLTFNALFGLGLVVITRALSPGRNHQEIVAGSRAGPGAAAPRGHALSTRASALALPVVAASACALRIPRSDSAKNNKSPPPAARHRLPSTDTASGIARRGASPPRPPRRPRPSSDHAPVTHPSSLTTTTPSLDACRRHAPGGHALLCQSLTPPRSFHVQLSPC